MSEATRRPETHTDARPQSRSTTAVLRCTGLSKAFGGHVVLDRLDFGLRPGEFVLLGGRNGSGKSTLLNILAGDVEPDRGVIEYRLNGAATRFEFPRPWWKSLNPRDRFSPDGVARLGISRTWQDIRLFGSQSLRDNIAVAAPAQLGERPWNVLLRPRAVARSEEANRIRADQALADLGLAGREASSGDRISRGQAKRVAIARAIFAQAGILFLDEPMAGLDEDGVHQVTSFLRSLRRTRAVSVVIVEHVLRLPRVLPLVDTVWTLDEGLLQVESASEAGDSIASVTVGEDPRRWVSAFGTPTRRVSLPRGALLTVHRRNHDASTEEVLAIDGLSVSRGNRTVLGDAGEPPLSLVLHDGDIGVLEAPNGWGKTTLMEAISGLLPEKTGSIRLHGNDLSELPPWERRARGVSMLQSRDGTFDNLTVQESFDFWRAHAEVNRLNGMMHRLVGTLSGGERQRVAVLSSVSGPPASVLLLDEPFSMLDQAGMDLVIGLIQRHRRGAILIALPGGAPGAT